MNDGRIVLCVVSVVATDYHCFRLHRILYYVLHSSDCSWVPSLLSVARIFVNYGTHCTFGYSSVCITAVLALDLEGVHDLKLHHPSSSVATSNQ